jgi:hypothetical protein
MSDFESYLPTTEKENIIAFCRGIIEYSRENLKSSLKYFSRTTFQNFIFKVQVKILQLKIYYRLHMYEEALGSIDSFKHYISREKNLLNEHRESYTQFLNLMSDLIKSADQPKTERGFVLSKIRKNAEKMPANPFRVKVWLLNQLEQVF